MRKPFTWKSLGYGILIGFLLYQIIAIANYFVKDRIMVSEETVEIYWTRRSLPLSHEESRYSPLIEITDAEQRRLVLNTVAFLNGTDPMHKQAMTGHMILDSGASPDNRIQLIDGDKHYEIAIEEWQGAFDEHKIYVFGVNAQGLRVMLYRYWLEPEDMAVINQMYAVVEALYGDNIE